MRLSARHRNRTQVEQLGDAVAVLTTERAFGLAAFLFVLKFGRSASLVWAQHTNV
jgi:hypothetical protein